MLFTTSTKHAHVGTIFFFWGRTSMDGVHTCAKLTHHVSTSMRMAPVPRMNALPSASTLCAKYDPSLGDQRSAVVGELCPAANVATQRHGPSSDSRPRTKVLWTDSNARTASSSFSDGFVASASNRCSNPGTWTA